MKHAPIRTIRTCGLKLAAMFAVRGGPAAKLLVSLVLSVLSGIQVANAKNIDHGNGFASNSDLMANGSASFVGTTAVLTDGGFVEAGSIFTVSPVQIKNFSSDFTFTIRPGQSGLLADGITFCIQSAGPSALGQNGGALGYAGIASSVAIKFDVFDNDGEGNDSTGVFSGGEFPSVPQSNGDVLIALHGTGIDLTSGDLFHAVISYQGGQLDIAIADVVTGASFEKTISIDIPSLVGGDQADVGFTGATAGGTAVQTIYTWVFAGAGGK